MSSVSRKIQFIFFELEKKHYGYGWFALEEAHRLEIKRGPRTEPWGTPKQQRWEMNIHPDHHICAGFFETVMREKAEYAIVNFACDISCSLIQSAQCFFACPSHESSSTECKTRLGKPGFARSQVKPVCEIHRVTRLSKPGRLLLCSTAYSAVWYMFQSGCCGAIICSLNAMRRKDCRLTEECQRLSSRGSYWAVYWSLKSCQF